MKISAYATHESYWRHLAPIVDELRARGVEVTTWSRRGKPWGPAAYARRALVDDIVLTASWVDAHEWRDRVVVYVEHGAGQTYDTPITRLSKGYPGGDELGHVELFLCPSERVADLWRARYVARAEVVGCPALDGLSSAERGPRREGGRTGTNPSPRPVVAFTCHWRMGGDELPEGMPALPLYLEAIAGLDVDVLGHSHPRIRSQMQREFEQLGIRFEPDPDVVLSSIDLLVADNTSLMYEAAALDVPVLALNAPFYRRDVEHGLRFWQYVPGLQCDEPAHLASSIDVALRDGPVLKRLRARAARAAYDLLDGRAAARAADAILTLEGTTMPQRQVRQGQEVLVTPTEVSGRWIEVEERLYALGSTDELVDDMRTQWGKMTTSQQDRIRRLNDVLLRREIVLALRAGDSAEGIADPELQGEPYSELPSDDEIDEAANELLDKTDDGEILEALGTDVDLADRLFRLELTRETPRDGLLEAFASVAGFEYFPGTGEEMTAVEAEVGGDAVEISGDGSGQKLPPAPDNYAAPEAVDLSELDGKADGESVEVAADSESVTGDVESDDDDDEAELEDVDDDE